MGLCVELWVLAFFVDEFCVTLRELSLFFNSSGIAVVLLVLMGCVTCGVNDELLPYDQFCI